MDQNTDQVYAGLPCQICGVVHPDPACVKTKKKKKRREPQFCTDLVKALSFYGWAFKIPDSPFQKKSAGENRFSPPKQFDIICTSQRVAGRTIAVECKMWTLVKDPEYKDALKLLRKATDKNPGQFENLAKVQESGGCSFIAIKRYIPRQSHYFLFRLNSDRRARIETVGNLADAILEQGKKI